MTKHKSQDERRSQILAAAKRCFIRNGYADTRVDDIAAEAELSKGGIYFHFKSKRAILDALQSEQQAETMRLVDTAGRVEGGAIEQLRSLATQLLNHFSMADDRRKFLIVLAEMGIRDPQLHNMVLTGHSRYVESLTKQVQAGIDEGAFREVDAAQAALLLKLIIDGIEQALALGYQVDVPALLFQGLDIILNGLAKR